MANILVIDDSITIAKFVEMVLSAKGHTLKLALDGEEAVSMLNKEKIDIIIMDIVMPGKNGFQLCREIKKIEHFKNIPVIMLSTKGLDCDKFWAMKQGADDYLTKPCTPEALIGIVDKYAASRVLEHGKSLGVSNVKEKPQNPSYRFNN